MIKKVLCFSVLLVFSITFVSAQSVIEKSEDQIKTFNAQQLFYAGSYQQALGIYNDVLKNRPNDANIIFHIAECYFGMSQFAQAMDNAKKAESIDPKANENISLLLGKLYFMDGNLDSSLTKFTYFENSVKDAKKIKDSDVDMFITQINTG